MIKKRENKLFDVEINKAEFIKKKKGERGFCVCVCTDGASLLPHMNTSELFAKTTRAKIN